METQTQTTQGIKQHGPALQNDVIIRREFDTNTIYRSFDLKGKVNVDAIHASYTEGILRIVLPKTSTAQRSEQNVEVR